MLIYMSDATDTNNQLKQGKTMYLKRITGLAQFLSEGEKTSEELAKFLVLKTFSELSSTAVYLTEITSDGHLAPVAGFGYDKMVIAQWGRFPLSMHLPITESVRKDECIVVRSVEEFFENYPLAKQIESVDINWKAIMTFPMLPYGVGVVTLQEQPNVTDDLIYFARAIGAMLSLHFIKVPIFDYSKSRSAKFKLTGESLDLTERQKVVHQLMMKGFTNAQIASELGYSESLIRQETIQIFRILGVSGRKEIIKAEATA